MKATEHLYLHKFRSGNEAWIKFWLPQVDKPSPYEIKWLKAASASDVIEYRKIWRQAILKDLCEDGRKDHRMVDDVEAQTLATAEASQ